MLPEEHQGFLSLSVSLLPLSACVCCIIEYFTNSFFHFYAVIPDLFRKLILPLFLFGLLHNKMTQLRLTLSPISRCLNYL